MSFIKTTLMGTVLGVAALVNTAIAGEIFTQEAFTTAQAEGKHIVLDVWKKGCGTCAAQKPTLEKAKSLHPDAAFFRIDFVEQKNVATRFNVPKQSTIIVFKGAEETGRVTGETREQPLLDLIQTGV